MIICSTCCYNTPGKNKTVSNIVAWVRLSPKCSLKLPEQKDKFCKYIFSRYLTFVPVLSEFFEKMLASLHWKF